MTSITITLDHPPLALRPNSRTHWRRKAVAVKAYRRQAFVRAKEQLAGALLNWSQAKVSITWESRTHMSPDPDNIVASLKAAFDGLQDAGVVVSDRGLWPERPVVMTKRPWPQVVLTIEEEAA